MNNEYEIEPGYSVGVQSPYAASYKGHTYLYDVPGTKVAPQAPPKVEPEIPDDLLKQLLSDMKDKPAPKKSKKVSKLDTKALLAKENAKLLKEKALFAKDKLGYGFKDMYQKPGMVTGRPLNLRALGGGLAGSFMEGPEMQKAKSDPTYGMGEEERRNLEHAYQYGL